MTDEEKLIAGIQQHNGRIMAGGSSSSSSSSKDEDGQSSSINTTRNSPTQQQDQHLDQHHQHFKMYKPAKVLSQFVFNHRKRRKRTLLGDIYDNFPPGTMAIGRLDEDSEGLLLLTTDGKVSERMRRKNVEKEYWVQVDGEMSDEAMERLRQGVEIKLPRSEEQSGSVDTTSFEGGGSVIYTTLPCKARRLETEIVEVKHITTTQEQSTTSRKRKKFKGTCNRCGGTGHKARECSQNTTDSMSKISKEDNSEMILHMALPPGIPIPLNYCSSTAQRSTSWISLTITEGKYRQVRKMTAAIGYPTLRLVRVRIGTITLDGMAPGEVRMLAQTDMLTSI